MSENVAFGMEQDMVAAAIESDEASVRFEEYMLLVYFAFG